MCARVCALMDTFVQVYVCASVLCVVLVRYWSLHMIICMYGHGFMCMTVPLTE